MNLWIGRPGALREIQDKADSFDRSPALEVQEFRALSGAVTTWAPPVQPRRLTLRWTAMERDDFTHLDRLARRVDGPGPVAVLDPLSRNWLTAAQAAGTGSTGMWERNANEITLSGGTTPYSPVTVSVDAPPPAGAVLTWVIPRWRYYPVAPGTTLTWWTPSLAAAKAPLAGGYLYWYRADNTYLGAVAGSGTRPLVTTVPPGAAFARPGVAFTAKGSWPLGESVLAPGDLSTELLDGERPPGEGTPAYSITDYQHVAAADARYRDIGLDLVEVA
ncbi:hypothetical protein M1P56_21360 [Streptomyces sp. HU2014]|uniref:hypothetical protein n=1 Tax=Streptomyces sp. HU2014 TaxID=2939414 RepID=UPI00200FC656|nr:hypothetical protein [Streptomyces sp. HU2014]UQI46715.1 hypothetical protein M1P56_21360 [Streptomyces sp. HU2014]